MTTATSNGPTNLSPGVLDLAACLSAAISRLARCPSARPANASPPPASFVPAQPAGPRHLACPASPRLFYQQMIFAVPVALAVRLSFVRPDLGSAHPISAGLANPSGKLAGSSADFSGRPAFVVAIVDLSAVAAVGFAVIAAGSAV